MEMMKEKKIVGRRKRNSLTKKKKYKELDLFSIAK